jgi:hypothetical protein
LSKSVISPHGDPKIPKVPLLSTHEPNKIHLYTCGIEFTNQSRNDFIDFDECAEGTHSCPDNSTCNNMVGSFECPCDPGFVKSNMGNPCQG